MNSAMPIETARLSSAAATPLPAMQRFAGFADVLATLAGGEPQVANAPPPQADVPQMAAPAVGEAADVPGPQTVRLAAEPAAPIAAPSARPRPAAALPSVTTVATRKAAPAEQMVADVAAGGLTPQQPSPLEPAQTAAAAVPQPGGAQEDAPPPPQAALAAPAHVAGRRSAGPQGRDGAGDPGTPPIAAEPPPDAVCLLGGSGLADPGGTARQSSPNRAAAAADRVPRTKPEPDSPARGNRSLSTAHDVPPVSASPGKPLAPPMEASLSAAGDISAQPEVPAPIAAATTPPAHAPAPQPVANDAVTSFSPAIRVEAALPALTEGNLVAGDRSPGVQAADAVRFLARSKDDGTRMLILRLDPEELGRVQISITQIRKGPASIAIRVEQPETLLLLLRDQGQLHRALDSAGITPEGRQLSFHLAPAPVGAVRDGGAAGTPSGVGGAPDQGAFHTGSGHAGEGREHGGRRDPGGTAASGLDLSTGWNTALIAGKAPGQRGRAAHRGVDITA